MKILPEPLAFEWNEGNFDKNYVKHQVTNKEAEEIFESRSIFYFEDVKHSEIEQRYMVWGRTKKGRRLSIIFTVRKQHVRIISARDMNKKERSVYEEKTQKNSNL